MQIDRAFDSYEIAMWDDTFRYRCTRHRLAQGQTEVSYLARDAAGRGVWVDDKDQAETWGAVQNACVCLVHKLNQDGVTG